MTGLLVIGLVVLAFLVRRQGQRIDALERALRAVQAPAPEPEAQPAAPIDAPVEVRRPGSIALSRWNAGWRRRGATEKPPTAARDAAAPAGGGFEQIVGGRLPIWVGGAALAIAGYFLVRLAIESGLLTPPVRVLLASLFGFVLLALSEAAARIRRIADDARVHQALAGAGLATLYAAAYLAGSHYGLVGPVTAFVMMAAITALALLLALKRGSPAALMGLIGGFATPLLSGAQDNAVVPLIAYLTLLSGGLLGLAVVRGWLWLALSAAAGSLLWSGLLIATTDATGALTAGAFAALLGVAATLTIGVSGGAGTARLLRLLPLVVAAIELAILIATVDFGGGAWGLYLLLSAAIIVLAYRDARLTPAVVAALLLSGLALAVTARGPSTATTIAAATGLTLLFGGAGHGLARRRPGAWWAAIGAMGVALPFLLLRDGRPQLMPDGAWSGLALLLALPPLHLAWRSRDARSLTPPYDPPLQIGAGMAAALLSYGLAIAAPASLMPASILVAAAILAQAGRHIGDGGLLRLAMAACLLGLLAVLARSALLIEAIGDSLLGTRVLLAMLPRPREAVLGALLPAGLAAWAAWRAADAGSSARRTLLFGAGLAAAAGLYPLWKQLFGIADEGAFTRHGFLERALLTQAMFAAGWGANRAGWTQVARLLTALAVARILWLDCVVFNPAFVRQSVGPLPIANLIGAHFAAATLWIGLSRRSGGSAQAYRLWLAALVTVATAGTLLIVRQAFHGTLLTGGAVGRGEFYGYSVAGVLLAIALFGWGARARDRGLRVAALGLLTLMVLKVFLIDAAALEGALRIASFLGLGVALIGIGWAYGRFLGGAPRAETVVRA